MCIWKESSMNMLRGLQQHRLSMKSLIYTSCKCNSLIKICTTESCTVVSKYIIIVLCCIIVFQFLLPYYSCQYVIGNDSLLNSSSELMPVTGKNNYIVLLLWVICMYVCIHACDCYVTIVLLSLYILILQSEKTTFSMGCKRYV